MLASNPSLRKMGPAAAWNGSLSVSSTFFHTASCLYLLEEEWETRSRLTKTKINMVDDDTTGKILTNAFDCV